MTIKSIEHTATCDKGHKFPVDKHDALAFLEYGTQPPCPTCAAEKPKVRTMDVCMHVTPNISCIVISE